MGRILGIDFGTKRVGAAISDARRQIVSPLEVYVRTRAERDAGHYRALVADHEVVAIVVGMPFHEDGWEGTSAQLARKFGEWLARETRLPVYYQDERYTSFEAEDTLRDAGVHYNKRRNKRDKLAAGTILQGYLDAGCPGLAKDTIE